MNGRRPSRGRRPNPAAANRTARVGELIRRILADQLEEIDDERFEMVSVTSVVVDRELHRAVVWFTTLHGDDDPEILDAFEEHRGRMRKAVSREARLRHTPELEFRADDTLRSAERIEQILRDDDRPPVPEVDPDGEG